MAVPPIGVIAPNIFIWVNAKINNEIENIKVPISTNQNPFCILVDVGNKYVIKAMANNPAVL